MDLALAAGMRALAVNATTKEGPALAGPSLLLHEKALVRTGRRSLLGRVRVDEARSVLQSLTRHVEPGDLVVVLVHRELQAVERDSDILFADSEEAADADNDHAGHAGL